MSIEKPESSHDPSESPQSVLIRQIADVYDRLAPYFMLGGNWVYLQKTIDPFMSTCQKNGIIPAEPLIIDCGCGTAQPLISLVSHLNGKGVGIDISEEMMRVASRKAQESGKPLTMINADFRDPNNGKIAPLLGNADVILDIGAADGYRFYPHMWHLLQYAHYGTLFFSVIFYDRSDAANQFTTTYGRSETAMRTGEVITQSQIITAPNYHPPAIDSLSEGLESTRVLQQGVPKYKFRLPILSTLRSPNAVSAVRGLINLASDRDFAAFNKSILRPTERDIIRFVTDTGVQSDKITNGPFQPYFITGIVTDEMIAYVNEMADREGAA